jgi:hypothetical protein
VDSNPLGRDEQLARTPTHDDGDLVELRTYTRLTHLARPWVLRGRRGLPAPLKEGGGSRRWLAVVAGNVAPQSRPRTAKDAR